MEPALKAIYKDKVVSGLKEKYSYGNVHQVPTIEKVVLSSGFGKEDDYKNKSYYGSSLGRISIGFR